MQYRILDAPLSIYACHCKSCQTQTGSAFALFLIVATRQLKTLGSEPEAVEHGPFAIHRCRQCSVALWDLYLPNPDLTLVRAGGLDDTGWIVPVAHLWTEDAQPWIRFNDDAAQFRQGLRDDDGPQYLIDLYAQRIVRRVGG